MTLTLTVLIGYHSPQDRADHQTHLILPYDDKQPLGAIRRTVDAAVLEWGRVMGYKPFEWEIKSVYLGRSDFFRGAVKSA